MSITYRSDLPFLNERIAFFTAQGYSCYSYQADGYTFYVLSKAN